MRGQAFDKYLNILARAVQLLNHLKCLVCLLCLQGRYKIKHKPLGDSAQRLPNALLSQRAILIQAHIHQAPGITHAALSGGSDQLKRLFLRAAAFFNRQAEPADHVRFGYAAKLKALAAGEDGGRYLLQLSGRQNENHVRRRFFQRFQERVEGRV